MENSRNRFNDTLGINKLSRNIRKNPPFPNQNQLQNKFQNQPQNPFQNPAQPQNQFQTLGRSQNQLQNQFQNLGQNQFQNQAQNEVQNEFQNQGQNQQPHIYNISKNDFRSVVQQLTGTPTRDPSPVLAPVPPRPKVPSQRLQKIRPPPLAPLPPPIRALYPRPVAPPVPSPTPSPSTFWRAVLESPTTAYAKYLESSVINGPLPGPVPADGLLPSPGPPPAAASSSSGLLPSPTAFAGLSPFPVGAPKFQFPPLSPGFQFSPLPGQGGILGPGPGPPGSPLFPLSPSAFLLSPRWRDF